MSKRRKSGKQVPNEPKPDHRQTGPVHAIRSLIREQRDYGFLAIVILLAVIALWVLLMPWSRAVAWTSMRRFHLRTSSFLGWAVQFPIPAMYNFANRAEVDRYPPGLVDPLLDETERRHLNHFPVRCITFADGRYRHFEDGKDRWIIVDSSYRGRTLESRFHATPKPEGGYELNRLADVESSR